MLLLSIPKRALRYIQEFKGFSEDDAYAVSQEIEPRTTLTNTNNNTANQANNNADKKKNESLIGEISAVNSPPPQKLLNTSHKTVRDDDGKVPFLDLRGTVLIKLQVYYSFFQM